MSQIVWSGEFARVHYALVLASSVAAIGGRAVLFFTGPAVRTLGRASREGAPAWHGLAGTGDRRPADLDAALADRGLATFEVLLQACREFGVRMMVCEMALRAADLSVAELRPDLIVESAGVVSLLGQLAKQDRLLFI